MAVRWGRNKCYVYKSLLRRTYISNGVYLIRKHLSMKLLLFVQRPGNCTSTYHAFADVCGDMQRIRCLPSTLSHEPGKVQHAMIAMIRLSTLKVRRFHPDRGLFPAEISNTKPAATPPPGGLTTSTFAVPCIIVERIKKIIWKKMGRSREKKVVIELSKLAH